MSQRRAVTKAIATRYRGAAKHNKARILDELCQTTGWHRDHARKALRQASGPQRVAKARKPCPPVYGEDVLEQASGDVVGEVAEADRLTASGYKGSDAASAGGVSAYTRGYPAASDAVLVACQPIPARG